MEVYEMLKKNQYGQYLLKDVLDGKYKRTSLKTYIFKMIRSKIRILK